jgi:hypothetical protein
VKGRVLFSRKDDPLLDELEGLTCGRLTEGPPKPKGKIRNSENFALGITKWGIEYLMFNAYGERVKVFRFK